MNGECLMNDALEKLRTHPSMTLDDWAMLNNVGRNTAYKEAKEGRIEGLYRIGNQYRIATPPWRKRLGVGQEAA